MADDLKKEQPSHFASVRDSPQHKLQIKVPVALHFRFPFRELQTVHFAIDDYFLIMQLRDLYGLYPKNGSSLYYGEKTGLQYASTRFVQPVAL